MFELPQRLFMIAAQVADLGAHEQCRLVTRILVEQCLDHVVTRHEIADPEERLRQRMSDRRITFG